MAKTNNAAQATAAEGGEVKKKKGNLYVTKEFRDKSDFNQIYAVGEDVTEIFEGDRREEVLGHGVVEVHGEAEKTEPDGGQQANQGEGNPPA